MWLILVGGTKKKERKLNSLMAGGDLTTKWQQRKFWAFCVGPIKAGRGRGWRKWLRRGWTKPSRETWEWRRTEGSRTEKKVPWILRKFLVPVASRKLCWEDNVTEADLRPIISVTGREEILEHVLILTLLGGQERSTTLKTRLYWMTFHF